MDSSVEVRVCENCRVIVVAAGSGYGHAQWAAEKFSTSVCAEPVPGRRAKPREIRYGRGDTVRSDRFSVQNTIDGFTVDAGAPVVLAVNGSYKARPDRRQVEGVSWGYLADTGAFGLGTTVLPAALMTAKPGLHAELRALWRGLRRVLPRNPVLVVTPNADVARLVTAWRTGATPMPRGYDPRPRQSGRTATLVQLAELVHAHTRSVDTLVRPADSGDPLGEGAHALARVAQAWSTGRLDKDDAGRDARRIAYRTLSPPLAATRNG